MFVRPTYQPYKVQCVCLLALQLDAFRSWLKEQEDAQDKKQPTEEPAFMSSDVVLKWTAVEKAVQKLDNKKKPKPPPVKKNETETAGSKADKDKDSSAESAEGASAGDKDGKAGAGDGPEGGSKGSGKSEKVEQAESEEELPLHEEL